MKYRLLSDPGSPSERVANAASIFSSVQPARPSAARIESSSGRSSARQSAQQQKPRLPSFSQAFTNRKFGDLARRGGKLGRDQLDHLGVGNAEFHELLGIRTVGQAP